MKSNIVQGQLFESYITLSKLESYIWEAANILRGSPVDRTDWKSGSHVDVVKQLRNKRSIIIMNKVPYCANMILKFFGKR